MDFSPRGRARSITKGRIMEKVLIRKVEKKKVTAKVDSSLAALERLTALNGSLIEQIKDLSSELDKLKDKVALVAGRLGL